MRLYIIQISHHAFYVDLGAHQYHITATHYADRASIFDCQGKALALNTYCLSAFVLPHHVRNREKLFTFFDHYFSYARSLFESHDTKQFLFIKRRLTSEEQNLIAREQISDMYLLKEPCRFYPCKAASPVIGITDIDNHGAFGIEQSHNALLQGEPTCTMLEKDARSGHFYFNKTAQKEGTSGAPLTLTLDGDIQFLVYHELAETIAQFHAQEGAAVVMDPADGSILAAVSFPCFDPENTVHLDIEHTKNKVIADCYELGSVMKVFAALAALEEKVVTPQELIDCKNSKTVYMDGRRINTWKEHGVIPFAEVIARSNNIGIALVTKRLGEKLYDHYVRIGFGQKTGVELPGEEKGFVNPPELWSKQSLISLSYGYEISQTLLQLATAFCMIAHDGCRVCPHIVQSEKNEQAFERLYSSETIAVMRDILEQTTAYGTARKAKIQGYRVMSKTGTANMLDDTGTYNPDKNIYTCAGIIEKGSYQRVIAVLIKEAAEKNLYASIVSAPLFERIAQRLLMHDLLLHFV
ncbi:MAG TPA: penicillin-binding protein 2 [Candidatus Bathyarchaeia archaeon]|nr:penicillin-binding protein 2 [Candidatus Bathyarchaeia archaeon]